jgi:hypothetical protein
MSMTYYEPRLMKMELCQSDQVMWGFLLLIHYMFSTQELSEEPKSERDLIRHCRLLTGYSSDTHR